MQSSNVHSQKVAQPMWTALAGGVGGAKFARGLAAIAPTATDELRIIVNTADDFVLHGLAISPDIDTVLYTLGGIANAETGWGVAADTFTTMDQLGKLGQETWFRLGDRDFATHITRTRWLHEGISLTEITRRLALALGIDSAIRLVPMTNDRVATEIHTPDGWLAFQDYFVRRHHSDPVRDVRFAGIDTVQPTSLAVEGLANADLIIVCPSNPIVSVAPILELHGMRAALSHRRTECCRVAISPIIGGLALKGPADQMLTGLGHESSALGVARLYAGLIDIFVIDEQDAALAPAIAALGMRPLVTQTIMRSLEDSRVLAETIVLNARSWTH